MHPKVMVERSKTAEKRLLEALNALAAELEIEPITAASHRDSDLRSMFTLESLADLAESIVKAAAPSAPVEQTETENEPEAKPKRGRKAKSE